MANGKWETQDCRSVTSFHGPPGPRGCVGVLGLGLASGPARQGRLFERSSDPKRAPPRQHPPTTSGKSLTLQNLSILTINQRSCTHFAPRSRGYHSKVVALKYDYFSIIYSCKGHFENLFREGRGPALWLQTRDRRACVPKPSFRRADEKLYFRKQHNG